MRRALAALLLSWALVQVHTGAQSDVQTYRLTGTRIAFGQDITVERDEEVRNAVVAIGGSVTVDGRVRDGIVVVGGNLQLRSTADVRGDVVVVGGELTRDAGARLLGDVSYVSFGDWSRGIFGRLPRFDFGGIGRWLTLAGTLARISVLAVLMALMLLVASAPVARVGRAAAAEPVRAVLVGLVAEIFFIPVLVATSIALAITIVGIPFVALLVPVAIALAFFAMLLGYTALSCRVGEWLEDRLGWHPGSAFVATALGFAAIVLPTVAARVIGVAPLPVNLGAFVLLAVGVGIEFVVWTMGLGAAILTGLGRWHVSPPPIVATPV